MTPMATAVRCHVRKLLCQFRFHHSSAMASLSECSVRQRLLQFHNTKYNYKTMENTVLGNMRHSAALVPLFFEEDELKVLLTVRSPSMKSHPGDVAFPGGMRDKEDKNEIATALREAEEEIGLSQTQVDVVCTLKPRVTRFKILMLPVIGFIPPGFKAVPNKEVDKIFSLPLSRFLMDVRHSSAKFTLNGVTGTVHTFNDPVGENNYTTWGLTASVCVELAVALLQRPTQYGYVGDVPLSPESQFVQHEKYLNAFLARPSSKL